MRVAVFAAVIVLSACAGEKLEKAPPPGVDLSGHWALNQADSDDPQHLLQTPTQTAIASPSSGGPTGSGGRGGGTAGGHSGGAPGLGSPTLIGPAMPSIGAMGDGLRWPGKVLEIKQVAGVVAFSSEGKNRICQPDAQSKPAHHAGADRDALPAAREAPPPICGWSEKTLIIRSLDPDEERPPFEESYSLSDDGQRLIEVVGFKGGRSDGFTMSRVWDRVAQGCYYADDPKKPEGAKTCP
jgi:hypothetical protein